MYKIDMGGGVQKSFSRKLPESVEYIFRFGFSAERRDSRPRGCREPGNPVWGSQEDLSDARPRGSGQTNCKKRNKNFTKLVRKKFNNLAAPSPQHKFDDI